MLEFKPDIFFNISFTDILGVGISIVTLGYAYRISKGFDVQKNYTNKQFETVMSLLQDINATNIVAAEHSKIPKHIVENMRQNMPEDMIRETTFSGLIHSLWLFASVSDNPSNIFFYGNVVDVFPFLTYIDNPLLPSTISKKLSALYSPFTNYSNVEKATDKFTVLSPYKGEQQDFLSYPDLIPAYKSVGNFQTACYELKEEITNWLNKYGAKDINFNKSIYSPTVKK